MNEGTRRYGRHEAEPAHCIVSFLVPGDHMNPQHPAPEENGAVEYVQTHVGFLGDIAGNLDFTSSSALLLVLALDPGTWFETVHGDFVVRWLVSVIHVRLVVLFSLFTLELWVKGR